MKRIESRTNEVKFIVAQRCIILIILVLNLPTDANIRHGGKSDKRNANYFEQHRHHHQHRVIHHSHHVDDLWRNNLVDNYRLLHFNESIKELSINRSRGFNKGTSKNVPVEGSWLFYKNEWDSFNPREQIASLVDDGRYNVINNQDIAWPVKKEATLEGDLILGGLMMVHEREDSVTCGPIMPEGGVQALETMLYTLDVLNNRPDLKFTLGAHILDDCDKDTYGLEMAVDFIKEYLQLSPEEENTMLLRLYSEPPMKSTVRRRTNKQPLTAPPSIAFVCNCQCLSTD